MKIIKNQTKRLFMILGGSFGIYSVLEYIPDYFKVLYIIRHVCLFLVYGTIALIVLEFIHKLIVEAMLEFNKKKTHIVSVLTTVVFVITLVIISNNVMVFAQNNHYEPTEIYYLDEYNNILYQNAIAHREPEITYYDKTANTLDISGIEHIEGNMTSYGSFGSENYEAHNGVLKATGDVIFDIHVEYDDHHNITKYISQKTILNVGEKETSKVYRYISMYKEIESSYTYNEDDLEQVKTNSSYVIIESNVYDDPISTELVHYTFTEEEIHQDTRCYQVDFTKDESKTIITSEYRKKNGELISSIGGTCEDDVCEYSLDSDGNTSVYKYITDDSQISIYAKNNSGTFNLLSSYRIDNENEIIENQITFFRGVYKSRNLYGRTYLHKKNSYLKDRDYIEIKETGFGKTITTYTNPLNQEYARKQLELIFLKSWGYNSSKRYLEHHLILIKEYCFERFIFEHNILYIPK